MQMRKGRMCLDRCASKSLVGSCSLSRVNTRRTMAMAGTAEGRCSKGWKSAHWCHTHVCVHALLTSCTPDAVHTCVRKPCRPAVKIDWEKLGFGLDNVASVSVTSAHLHTCTRCSHTHSPHTVGTQFKHMGRHSVLM